MNRLLSNNLYCYFAFAVIILIAHSNIIFSQSTMSPDAPYILIYMEELSSLKDYFQKLFSLQGLDFQPVRDLSLYIDLKIFRLTGINLFIINNCLIWSGCCYQIFQLSKFRNQEENSGFLLACVFCFSVHPVFSQTINWSMGRKHLLAVFFILFATNYFLKMIEGKKNGNWIFLPYLLSLLSVPVSLLWPVWAVITIFILKRESVRKNLTRIIPLFGIMIPIAALNYAYYFNSEVYKEIFIQKKDSIDYSKIFHHLGQYLKQIFYPFELRFHYSLEDSALVGLFILISFLVWIGVKYRHNRMNWIWIIFSITNIALFLRTPETFFDTYVILPVTGLFLVLLMISGRPSLPKYVTTSLLSLFFIGMTFSVNLNWKSLRAFADKNFTYNQDCATARSYAETFFVEKQKLPNELYDFIQKNDCLKPHGGESPVGMRGIRNFESRLLLIEDDVDFEFRQKKLQQLSQENYYPKILYALMMARVGNDEELEQTMNELNQAFAGTSTLLDYDPVATDELITYCQSKQLTECNRFTKRFAEVVRQPFL